MTNIRLSNVCYLGIWIKFKLIDVSSKSVLLSDFMDRIHWNFYRARR